MIYIEKNTVISPDEYYISIGFKSAPKNKLQEELDLILKEMDHTTTVIRNQFEDYPFFKYVDELISLLNDKHPQCSPLQFGFIDISRIRGLRIYSKNFERIIGHRPVKGRLDLDSKSLRYHFLS